MLAASRLVMGWTLNLNSLVGTLLKQSDWDSFAEEATYWRDSERVLAQALEELTVPPTQDINVAKLDSILTGTKEHKHFKNSVAKVKSRFRQAKTYNQFYSNTAVQLQTLHLRSLPEAFANILASMKLMPSKLFDESVRSSVMKKTVEFIANKVKTELPFNVCFRDRTDAALQSVLEGFEVLLKSEIGSFPKHRPRTAMTASSDTVTRPSTAASIVVDSSNVSEIAHYFVCIAADLGTMLHEYRGFLRTNPESAEELVKVYEQTSPEFDIWAKCNCLKWELLKKNFYQRLRPTLHQILLETEGEEEASEEITWSVS